MNVQHFESLNDTVCQITGVCVRETVPDRILDEADEVELVDIPPDALLNRLKRGAIYAPEKVDAGAQQLLPPRQPGGAARARACARPPRRSTTTSRSSSRPTTSTRRGARSSACSWRSRRRPAEREADPSRLPARAPAGGDLWVVHIRPAAVLLGAPGAEALDALRDLAEELGGHFIELGRR